MANFNVNVGGQWMQSSSVKVYKSGEWIDAQGQVYSGGQWQTFTEKFFVQLTNAIIVDGVNTAYLPITYDQYGGYFYYLDNPDYTTINVKKYHPETGSTVLNRTSSVDYESLYHPKSDGDYLYAVSNDYFYKISLSSGSIVQETARIEGGSSAYHNIYLNDYQPYFYCAGAIYSKSTLLKYRDLHYTGNSIVVPFDNSSSIITILAGEDRIVCQDSYGTTSGKWGKSYPNNEGIEVVVKNGYTYALVHYENRLELHKYTSSGTEVFSKTLSSSKSYGSITVDDSNNVYAFFTMGEDFQAEKYSSGGKREYMYYITNLENIANDFSIYHRNGEIVLWYEMGSFFSDDKTYSMLFGNL